MPSEQLEVFLDNPAMREALLVVFERSDGGSEELRWTDVRDSLSSGQWGRLIEAGVLVGRGTGFTLDDPDRLQERLDDRGALPGDDGATGIEPEPWTWHDKAAGAAALLLVTGYWNTGVRNVVASFDNAVLAPVTDALPFYAVVLVLAVVTGFYSTVLQARLTDTETLEAHQERMSRLNERKAAAEERGDEAALERIQEEQRVAAGDQLGMLRVQFRPMVWIMLLTVPVFLWLRWKVRGGHLGVGETGLVVPLAGAVGWQEPLVGPVATWLVWYFLCSMTVRRVLQKTTGLQPTSRS